MISPNNNRVLLMLTADLQEPGAETRRAAGEAGRGRGQGAQARGKCRKAADVSGCGRRGIDGPRQQELQSDGRTQQQSHELEGVEDRGQELRQEGSESQRWESGCDRL